MIFSDSRRLDAGQKFDECRSCRRHHDRHIPDDPHHRWHLVLLPQRMRLHDVRLRSSLRKNSIEEQTDEPGNWQQVSQNFCSIDIRFLLPTPRLSAVVYSADSDITRYPKFRVITRLQCSSFKMLPVLIVKLWGDPLIFLFIYLFY